MTPKELDELDLKVAGVEGIKTYIASGMRGVADGTRVYEIEGYSPFFDYSPTRDGSLALRLLEKYGLELSQWLTPHGKPTGDWRARAANEFPRRGSTAAIAICLAVVALKDK